MVDLRQMIYLNNYPTGIHFFKCICAPKLNKITYLDHFYDVRTDCNCPKSKLYCNCSDAMELTSDKSLLKLVSKQILEEYQYPLYKEPNKLTYGPFTSDMILKIMRFYPSVNNIFELSNSTLSRKVSIDMEINEHNVTTLNTSYILSLKVAHKEKLKATFIPKLLDLTIYVIRGLIQDVDEIMLCSDNTVKSAYMVIYRSKIPFLKNIPDELLEKILFAYKFQ